MKTKKLEKVITTPRSVYMMPDHLHIRSPFILGWGCVYTALRESYMLCSNNPTQLCSASPGGTKIDQVQSVLLCFTCKHRNPIRNAPKSRLDNRIGFNVNEVDRLLGKLAKKTTNMVGLMKFFWHEIVSLGCFPGSV